MAKGVSLQVEGLEKLIKKLGAIPENVKVEFDALLSAAAKGFEDRAVGDAPTDEGFLKNNITTKRTGEMDYEVVSAAPYSAYVEWGTRGRVQVPADLQAYAAQFRGQGGPGEARKAILDWCKRKGIERYQTDGSGKKVDMWYLIFLSIMNKGVKPHPFFFKQMPQAQAEVNADLKRAVKNAMK